MKRFLATLILSSLSLSLAVHAETNNTRQEVIIEAVQQNSLLLQLQKKLAQSEYRHTVFLKNLDQAQDGLLEIQEVIKSLKTEVATLEIQLKNNGRDNIDVQSQKERKRMEIAQLESDVSKMQTKVEEQKNVVEQLVTLLYLKRGTYYEDSGKVNPVKVLASPESVSQTLQKVTYLDLLESESQNQIQKMVAMSDELGNRWLELRKKRKELEHLEKSLGQQKSQLAAELDAQQKMLEENQAEEAMFEAMLLSKDQRESELLKEIEIYARNVEAMENAINGKRGSLTEDEATLINQIQSEMISQADPNEAANFLDLDWPVAPGKGLTAFFHDGAYKERFGVDHYALDIRANQGSAIYTPADGVVSEVSFDPNSTRYAYIKISHRKGISTLYGHVSEVAVQTGDYVTRGQVIGATGATPNTAGSGLRTTGPHLHFEVYQDGVRVDPMLYLPLEEASQDDLPENYKSLLQSQLESKIKEFTTALSPSGS